MPVAARDSDPLSKRIAYFRRSFVRGFGRKPNALESVTLNNAAVLTAKAEAAAFDSSVKPNDLVRLTNAAQRARADMQALLTASKQRMSPLNAFDAYVAAQKGASA